MAERRKIKRYTKTHDHNGIALTTVTCRINANELDSLKLIAKAHEQRHTCYIRKLIKAEINRFMREGVDKGRVSVLRARKKAAETAAMFED